MTTAGLEIFKGTGCGPFFSCFLGDLPGGRARKRIGITARTLVLQHAGLSMTLVAQFDVLLVELA